ncbi:MAG: hypothetical protein NZ992_04640 [Candidatus Korarchaeum sp.]|nr:hypothetical protein [Candidatus Korarchaeum sp.]MDW8035417.1 hypothetical protein [Candidatus Korarchaeum sp.]
MRDFPSFEHVYNALMSELRGFVHGSECNMDLIKELIATLPSESLEQVIEQLRGNLRSWFEMGLISEERLAKGLEKLEEIKKLYPLPSQK